MKKTAFFFPFLVLMVLSGCEKIPNSSQEWIVVRNETFQVPPGGLWSYGNPDPNLTATGDLKWEISSDNPIWVEVVQTVSDLELLRNGLQYNSYPSLASQNVLQYTRTATLQLTAQTVILNAGTATATVSFKHWVK